MTALDERDVHDARILGPATAGADLERLVWFERNGQTLDTDGFIVLEKNARVADARVISLSDRPRKEMHAAVRSADAAGIEHVRFTAFFEGPKMLNVRGASRLMASLAQSLVSRVIGR